MSPRKEVFETGKKIGKRYILYLCLMLGGIIGLGTGIVSPLVMIFLLGGIIALGVIFTRIEAGLLLLVASFFVSLSIGALGARIRLADIFVIVLFGVWLIKILIKGGSKFVTTSIDFPLLIFISFGIASWFYSANIALSMKESLQWLISFAMLYYIVVNNVTNKKLLEKLLTIFLIGALFITAGRVYLFLAKTVMLGHLEYFRVGGSYIAALGTIMTFSLFLYAPSKKRKFWFLVIFFIFLAGLLLSLTRGAWLAGGISLIVISVLKSKRTVISFFVAGTIVLIIVSLCFPGFASLLKWRAQSIVDPRLPSSLPKRLLLIEGAWNMFKDHPLVGVGIDNFGQKFLLSYTPWELKKLVPAGTKELAPNIRPHNYYLCMLSELGIVGLGIFLWLVGIVLRHAVIIFKKSKGTNWRPICGGLLGCWLMFLFYCLWGDISGVLRHFFAFFPALIIIAEKIMDKLELSGCKEIS